MGLINCNDCGKQHSDRAKHCPKCGAVINNNEKKRVLAILLCFFLGGLGIHRFYAGKVGTGVLWLFTFGLFGIGTLVDFIMIACGVFKDSRGNYIREW